MVYLVVPSLPKLFVNVREKGNSSLLNASSHLETFRGHAMIVQPQEFDSKKIGSQ